MAVAGSYIAIRVRDVALRHLRAYANCARDLIVPLFKGIEFKAGQVEEVEYQRLGSEPASEDFDGELGDLAEPAQDVGLIYYDTMVGIRQSVLNLPAVGMFHLIEQELADLCRDGAFTVEPPRDSKFELVADWYQEHFLLDLRALPSWTAVKELKLVANSVKHAEGSSAQSLRERRPELFSNPVLREFEGHGPGTVWPICRPLAGEDLYVSPEILDEYRQAADEFLQSIAAYFNTHGDDSFPRD